MSNNCNNCCYRKQDLEIHDQSGNEDSGGVSEEEEEEEVCCNIHIYSP